MSLEDHYYDCGFDAGWDAAHARAYRQGYLDAFADVAPRWEGSGDGNGGVEAYLLLGGHLVHLHPEQDELVARYLTVLTAACRALSGGGP